MGRLLASKCQNLPCNIYFAIFSITIKANMQNPPKIKRIDIARFMIHDYDVLIFDEPTSNLDADTANEIFNMIFGIRDKIVIVITHDRSQDVLDHILSI